MGEQTVWSAELSQAQPNRVTSAGEMPRHGRYKGGLALPEQSCSGLALCKPGLPVPGIVQIAPAGPKNAGAGLDYCCRGYSVLANHQFVFTLLWSLYRCAQMGKSQMQASQFTCYIICMHGVELPVRTRGWQHVGTFTRRHTDSPDATQTCSPLGSSGANAQKYNLLYLQNRGTVMENGLLF